MADKIDRFAEDSYEKLKRKIRKVYREAALDVKRKLEDFTRKHQAKSLQLQARVEAGEIRKEDYQDWLRGQVFTGRRWEAKLDEITQTYVNADAMAREIVGAQDKEIFAYAANQTAETIDRHVKTAASFEIYDEKTVDRLLTENPQMLPEWKIDEPKDYTWNEKRVQNAITQGIIQGESVQKISERLTSELATSNAGKMQMFARTAVTGAHNAGRVERMQESEKMGITVLKKWLAVHDSRTRDSHAYLDGQTRKPNEDFVDQDGNQIAYPGDPTADPALVYNCRCTLTYVYPKYEGE